MQTVVDNAAVTDENVMIVRKPLSVLRLSSMQLFEMCWTVRN